MEAALVVLITVAVVTYLVTVIHAATARSLADQAGEARPETHLIAWPRWMLGLLVLLVAVWLLYQARAILTPFVLGGFIAYVLNPITDRLAARGIPRGAVISLVFLALAILVVLAAVLIIPAVARQARLLVENYDDYARSARGYVAHAEQAVALRGGRLGVSPADVSRVTGQVGEHATAWGLQLLKSGLSGVNRGLSLILLLVVTPVVVFWLLRDYHSIGRLLLRPLPEASRQSVVEIAGEVNRIVGGYVLGLLIMIVVVSTYSSLVLAILGVRLSLLLGLLTGLLCIIPYFGFPTAMLTIAITMAATGESVGLVALAIGLHILGNIGSDYLIYPRVVGRTRRTASAGGDLRCWPGARC